MTPELAVPPPDDPVDFSRLREMSDGEASGIKELAEMYTSAMDGNIRKLQDALANSDAEELEHIAHSAVGASALIGMTAVIPALRKIELLGERGLLNDVPGAVTELVHAYQEILNFLAEENIITPRPLRR